ncbi:MAG: M1 family aminopeptidase, partial [Acidobacteriota bacterium]
MRLHLAVSVCILRAGLLAARPGDLAGAPAADLLAVYEQLRGLSLDANRTAAVENLELRKDAAAFLFKDGRLYFFEPVGGETVGAVFLGRGVFTLKPPTEIERRQMGRFNDGKLELEEPFQKVALVFTDDTFRVLSGQLKSRPGTVAPEAAGVLRELRDRFREDLRTNLEARVLAGQCSSEHGLFLAVIHGEKHGQLLFEIDPQMDEPVQLLRHKRDVFSEIWSSFAPGGGPAGTAQEHDLADVTNTKLDVTIDKGEKLKVEAELEFTALVGGPRLLRLNLAPTLRVSRITDASGNELKFIQEDKKKDADLWVILPEPLAKGRQHTWKMSYAGDEVIEDAGAGVFFVGERTRWYPSLDSPARFFGDRSMFELRFQAPKEYTLVATGRLLKREQSGRHEVSEWRSEIPWHFAGFNYGSYRTRSFKANSLEVTVYANPELPNELRRLQLLLETNRELAMAAGITPGGFNTTGMMAQTGAEAVNSVNLFSHYFGALPFHALSLTQQPAGFFGQSWPTLIFMPYTAFLDATIRNQLQLSRGRMRQFLEEVGSHEVAHQWWGHIVSPRTYHDAWLSEGFAQFSAGLYLHRTQRDRTQGDKKLEKFLEAERELILDRLENGQRANEVGPIWLGPRLDSEKTPGAYRLVYTKGGYVLHMLRMMLYDLSRDNDTRFINMMQDFVRTYQQRDVSTADFKAIVDKHFGADMGWFFRQWVYGTEIPKVSVRYALAEAAAGVDLAGVISLKGVSPDCRLMLPFVLRSKQGRLSGKINARGEST